VRVKNKADQLTMDNGQLINLVYNSTSLTSQPAL